MMLLSNSFRLAIDSSIQEVNTETGTVRQVLAGVGLTAPGGLAIYNDSLYVADLYSYRNLDRQTGTIQQTFRNWATPSQFPIGISVNESHVISSSWFAGVVQRLDRVTGAALNAYRGFAVPYDAVELSDGSLLVADCATGRITQILDSAGLIRRTVAQGLACPTGLALENQSRFLVTESVGNRLLLVDIATGVIQVIASNLLSPEGVAYHPNGIALVAEVGSKSLTAIEISSGKSIVLADNLPIGLLGYPGGPPPYGFTGVALSGNTAYISGDLDNSIKFSSSCKSYL